MSTLHRTPRAAALPTLDAPELSPVYTAPDELAAWCVVADDAPGPFPRIGDVAKLGARRWRARPMGAEEQREFTTRREAVAFIVETARTGAEG